MRVLMVCLGNICRSPSAESILRQKLWVLGLLDKVTVASAGIGGWHEGDAPDKRAQLVAKQRGFDLSDLKARQIKPSDFADFDVVLGMDKANVNALKQMPQQTVTIDLLLNYAFAEYNEVTDPYYGDISDFERMFDELELACDAVINRIKHHN